MAKILFSNLLKRNLLSYSLLALAFMFTLSSVSIAQTNDKQTLASINRSLIEAIKVKNYNEALNFAKQSVDLSLKLFGYNNLETAIAYKNLGIIYQDLNLFQESIENLQTSLVIYEKNAPQTHKDLAGIYENLAVSYSLFSKEKEAEEFYFKSLEQIDKGFGKDSKESLNIVFAIAKFYNQKRDFEKSDLFFLRSYELIVKNFGRNSPQMGVIADTRICLNVGSESRQKKFYEEVKKLIDSENFSILNGKAIVLVQPKYPPAASAVRALGTVTVKVWIDEGGSVYQTKVMCGGHPLLRAAALDAASRSKFSVTKVNGQPIKVQGHIVYNFTEL